MQQKVSVLFWTIAVAVALEGRAQNSKSRAATEIQAFLDSAATEGKLSGAVLVAKDGVPLASKVAGMANRAAGEAITLETKFNLGSLNKMFTSVAIAQLAQKGRLKFTDTVGQHLPDYPNKDVAGKVTIHHLLTHTSGLGSYWNEKFAAERTQLVSVAAHLPLFATDPLSFPPGEKFQYSNAGFMLLGAIIETITGQDYYEYVREHVYRPAGMTETGFYEPGKEIPQLAIGYTKTNVDGRKGDVEKENTDQREVKGGPPGGGYSTVGDLVKFHLALRDRKLLDDEHTKLITTGKVDAGGPMGKYAYGFGDKVFAGKHLIGHNGGNPGIAANFEMYPELGYTAVIMMNTDAPAMFPMIMRLRELLPAG